MLCDAYERYRFSEILTPAGSKRSTVESQGIFAQKSSTWRWFYRRCCVIVLRRSLTSFDTRKIIVYELLVYLCFYCNSGNFAGMKKVLSCFCFADKVSHAKQSLLNAFDALLYRFDVCCLTAWFVDTKSTATRKWRHRRCFLLYPDRGGRLTEVQFVAANLDCLLSSAGRES